MKRAKHIAGHTGLRGIGVVSVASVHLHFDLLFPERWGQISRFLTGWYPVDVFFILSGFILAYIYVDSASDFNCLKNDITWRSFFIKRFARIYPLHFLTLVLVGVMALSASIAGLPNRGYYLSDLPIQLFLVYAFPYVEEIGWIYPSWSISMEMLAYVLIFPFLIFVWRKKSSDFFILFVIVLLTVFWALYGRGHISGWGAVIRVSCGFSIGFGIYKLFDNNQHVFRFCQYFATYCFFFYIAFYLFAWVYMVPSFVRALVLHLLLIPVILGITRERNSYVSSILGCNVLVWLGAISYSIYMLHSLFGKVVNGLSAFLPQNVFLLMLIASLIISGILLVSHLTYSFFEVPCRNFISRRLGSHKS